MSNPYLTKTGNIIGNKTACNLFIARAEAFVAEFKAEQPDLDLGPIGKHVQVEFNEFNRFAKVSASRAATIKAMLTARGYGW